MIGVAIKAGIVPGTLLYALIWRAGRVRGDAGLRIAALTGRFRGWSAPLCSAVIEVIGPFLKDDRLLASPVIGGSLFPGAREQLGAVDRAWALFLTGRGSMT